MASAMICLSESVGVQIGLGFGDWVKSNRCSACIVLSFIVGMPMDGVFRLLSGCKPVSGVEVCIPFA